MRVRDAVSKQKCPPMQPKVSIEVLQMMAEQKDVVRLTRFEDEAGAVRWGIYAGDGTAKIVENVWESQKVSDKTATIKKRLSASRSRVSGRVVDRRSVEWRRALLKPRTGVVF